MKKDMKNFDKIVARIDKREFDQVTFAGSVRNDNEVGFYLNLEEADSQTTIYIGRNKKTGARIDRVLA